MRKPAFCICENKDADQLCGISVFVYAARIVQLVELLMSQKRSRGHFLSIRVCKYQNVCFLV